MAKKDKQPSFDEVLNALRGYEFDVEAGSGVAKTVRVSKYGCAALLAPGDPGGKVTGSGAATALGRATVSGRAASGGHAPTVAIVGRAGVVVNSEIGHILDKGYQKFVKTEHAELPATAEALRALHKFSEELRQITGNISLYNESMGTVSDTYMYDRVKGRTLPEAERPTPAWELPGKPG